MSTSILTDWGLEQAAALGVAPLVAHHRLDEHPLLTDEALIGVLDSQPPDKVGIYTMGTDPTRPEDFQFGLRGGTTGEQLFDAVQHGRLWLNVVTLQEFHPEWRDLLDQLYDEVEAGTPGFVATQRSLNLLISSPNAMVYYHADAPLNMLWHVRGRKRVRVYPVEERFLPQDCLEKIFSNESGEEVPYDPSFDDDAATFDLEPGQLVTWPQNAPHRVENTSGLNVSLSTEHYTDAAIRRERTYLANYYLRRWTHLPFRSTRTTGPVSSAKQLTYRVGKRFLPRTPPYDYPRGFEVDPTAEQRIRRLHPEPAASA